MKRTGRIHKILLGLTLAVGLAIPAGAQADNGVTAESGLLPAQGKFSFEWQGAYGNTFVGMADNGKGAIVAAADQTLLVSSDGGEHWQASAYPEHFEVVEPLFIQGEFVLLGKTGLLESQDGKRWEPALIPDIPDRQSFRFTQVQMLNGRWVLIGTDDVRTWFYTSEDGKDWTLDNTADHVIYSIAWTGKAYAGLGQAFYYFGAANGRNRIKANFDPKSTNALEFAAFTSPDMRTWTQHSGFYDPKLQYTAAYDDGNGHVQAMSSGGIPPAAWDGKHLVVMHTHFQTLTSTDGITYNAQWDNTAFHAYDQVNGPYWNGSVWLMYARKWRGDGAVLVSHDKVKWKEQETKGVTTYLTVRKIRNHWVSYGEDGTIAVSDDGLAWKVKVPKRVDGAIRSMVFIHGKYVAAGSEQVYSVPSLYRSTNGSTWSIQRLRDRKDTANQYLNALVWNGKTWLAAGSGVVYRSADGASWKPSKLPSGWTLNHAVWFRGKYAAIAEAYADGRMTSLIVTSADGVQWKKETSSTTARYLDIATDGKRLVVSGTKNGKGLLLNSTDGANWKEHVIGMATGTYGTDGLVYGFFHVAYAGGRFVVAGDKIYTSADGSDWQAVNGDYDEALGGDVWKNNGLLAWTGSDYVYVTNGVLGISSDLSHWDLYQAPVFREGSLLWNGSVGYVTGENGKLLKIKDLR